MRHRPLRLGMFLNIVGHYYDELRQGIAEYHRLHGPWEFWHEFIQIDLRDLRRVKETDGLITVLGHRSELERVRLARAIGRSGKPAVDVTPGDIGAPFPSVRADDVAVGRAAAEYLLGLGFATFGFLGMPLPFSQDRERGFSQALAAHGHRCLLPDPLDPWWDRRKQSAEWRRWFKSLPTPAAILAATDSYAGQAIVEAQAAGLLVPDRLAIMGVDNGTLCDLAWPSLTSVPLNGVRAGFEAARLLHQLIEGQTAPTEPMLIPPLPVVSRGSTDSLAIDDAEVIAVVRYIRERCASKLTTAQIVRHVAVSRRKLERRFQSLLHHSIGEEIRRAHTRRAMELLRYTRLPIEEVALNCGFESAAGFTRMFKRVAGLSPSRYRQQAESGSRSPREKL